MITNIEELIQALKDGKHYIVTEHNFRPEVVGKERMAVAFDNNKISTINVEDKNIEGIEEIAKKSYGLDIYNPNDWKFKNGLCIKYIGDELRFKIKFI